MLIDGIRILKDCAFFPSVNIEWLSKCYILLWVVSSFVTQSTIIYIEEH